MCETMSVIVSNVVRCVPMLRQETNDIFACGIQGYFTSWGLEPYGKDIPIWKKYSNFDHSFIHCFKT